MIQEAEQEFHRIMQSCRLQSEECSVDHESSLEALQIFDDHRYEIIQTAFYKFYDTIQVSSKIYEKVALVINVSLL